MKMVRGFIMVYRTNWIRNQCIRRSRLVRSFEEAGLRWFGPVQRRERELKCRGRACQTGGPEEDNIRYKYLSVEWVMI